MTDKWHKRFASLAETVAEWSKDPDCKVGAVVVSPDRRNFALGFNGFAAGVDDSEYYANVTKVVKNSLTIHAELNAILNARTNLTGWTLYTTKAPCLACATAAVQAGISTVVYPKLDPKSSWFDDNLSALGLLIEAKIVLIQLRDEEKNQA